MKKVFAIWIFLFTSVAFAQTAEDAKKDPSIYKINFAVMEVQNGQRSNIRNYVMFLPASITNRVHSTRVGNRIPVPGGKDGSVQYMDVGLNLNCSISVEKADGILLDFNFDLGSLVAPEANASERIPVVRQLRQDGVTYLPLGKATQIASADDTNTTRTVVVEATATKVK